MEDENFKKPKIDIGVSTIISSVKKITCPICKRKTSRPYFSNIYGDMLCLSCKREIDLGEAVKEYKKAQNLEYWKSPKGKLYRKEYQQRSYVKEKRKEYYSRPEVKEKLREYREEYYSRLEVKERMRQRRKKYRSRPDIKEKIKQYNKEIKERKKLIEKNQKEDKSLFRFV